MLKKEKRTFRFVGKMDWKSNQLRVFKKQCT